MRYLRDLLTLLVLLACVGISVAAMMQAARTGLPVQFVDDHEAFVRVLAAGDIRDLPLDQQRRHLRQLERELRRGVDWEADFVALKGRRRKWFVENLVSLAELWIDERRADWLALPDARQRELYLDGEIRNLRNMKALQDGAFRVAMDESHGLSQALSASAKRRFEQAPWARQGALVSFASEVQRRWKEQGFQGILPPNGPQPD